MLLTLFVALLATGTGWLRRGQSNGEAMAPLLWWPLLVLALVSRLVAIGSGGDAAVFAQLVMLTALLWFCLRNFSVVGMSVVALGLSANLVPLTINEGTPVRASAAVEAGLLDADELSTIDFTSPRHLETSEDRLAILGDVVPLKLTRQVYSFGDLILLLGLASVVHHGARNFFALREREAVASGGLTIDGEDFWADAGSDGPATAGAETAEGPKGDEPLSERTGRDRADRSGRRRALVTVGGPTIDLDSADIDTTDDAIDLDHHEEADPADSRTAPTGAQVVAGDGVRPGRAPQQGASATAARQGALDPAAVAAFDPDQPFGEGFTYAIDPSAVTVAMASPTRSAEAIDEELAHAAFGSTPPLDHDSQRLIASVDLNTGPVPAVGDGAATPTVFGDANDTGNVVAISERISTPTTSPGRPRAGAAPVSRNLSAGAGLPPAPRAPTTEIVGPGDLRWIIIRPGGDSSRQHEPPRAADRPRRPAVAPDSVEEDSLGEAGRRVLDLVVRDGDAAEPPGTGVLDLTQS